MSFKVFYTTTIFSLTLFVTAVTFSVCDDFGTDACTRTSDCERERAEADRLTQEKCGACKPTGSVVENLAKKLAAEDLGIAVSEEQADEATQETNSEVREDAAQDDVQ